MAKEMEDSYFKLIKRLDPEKLRERMIKRYMEIKSISQVAREYSTTRKTVRKWLKRFLQEENLASRSKAPKHPKRYFGDGIKEIIVKFRRERPLHGYSKLLKYLLKNHPEIQDIPSKTTVYKIWKEHGLLRKFDNGK